jgi:tetrahydromethanopterin S-methyltransferase subunit D
MLLRLWLLLFGGVDDTPAVPGVPLCGTPGATAALTATPGAALRLTATAGATPLFTATAAAEVC